MVEFRRVRRSKRLFAALIAGMWLIVGSASAVWVMLLGIPIAAAAVAVALWLILRPTSDRAFGVSFALSVIATFSWSVITVVLALDQHWALILLAVAVTTLPIAIASLTLIRSSAGVAPS
jgi:uncharacterized membrane protein YesL